LVSQTVRNELKKEIKKSQDTIGSRLNLSPGESALFINGIYFDADVMDVFALVETLRAELRVMEGLHSVGVTETEWLGLLSLDFSSPG